MACHKVPKSLPSSAIDFAPATPALTAAKADKAMVIGSGMFLRPS